MENNILKYSIVLLLCVSAPGIAEAKLLGADREEFVEGFSRGCYQSSDSRSLIGEYGGGSNELKQYCECVASVYAENLDVETIRTVSEEWRQQLADFARKVCLERVF